MSDGLGFYWTLAATASEVAGGKRAVVQVGDPNRDACPEPRDDERPRGGKRREQQRPPGYDLRPPEVHVSLRIDTDASAHGDEESALRDFVRHADRLLLREQFHRALRDARAKIRAFESRAVHDLRALLQPLVLHVDRARQADSVSADDLELLADLTRSLVEWVEEDFPGGTCAEDRRRPSTSPTEGTDLRATLEDVLPGADASAPTARFRARLPELDVDRPALEAGLRELLRLAGPVAGTIDVSRAEDGGVVRIRVELDDGRPPVLEASPPTSDEGEYPPVIGGLLNLTAWMDGVLLLETGAGRGGRIEVRLPSAGPSVEAGRSG